MEINLMIDDTTLTFSNLDLYMQHRLHKMYCRRIP